MADKRINDLFITGDQTYATIDQSVGRLVLDPKAHTTNWLKWLVVGVMGSGLLMFSIAWLIFQGTGTWGNNVPAAWGFDIVNFVWWIGIGHAGTLISAILLLLRQQWRNSINRFSEAMTIFAVMCAGIYPLLHTGRPWNDYWLFPYPNILGMWPQFRSPLLWDVFAVSTYFSVSLVFWFVGLIPDFANLRDRATNKYAKLIFALLALGWRGSNQHWHRYEQMYYLLAGLSAPLVLSVHSIVSFDFAISIVPGWNVTVFPPYFVAGAVFAGFAMVIIWAIPLRKYYKLEHLITNRHLDWMAKITLATGLIVFYGYFLEVFFQWYSGNPYEFRLLTKTRFDGMYAKFYWALIVCNGIIPQIFWWNKARTSTFWLLFVSTAVSIGMWLERFVIIPMSLTSNYLPSSNKPYYPSFWDFAMFAGTLGFFTMLMILFIRFLPMINIFEVKDLLYKFKGKKEYVEGQLPVEMN